LIFLGRAGISRIANGGKRLAGKKGFRLSRVWSPNFWLTASHVARR